MTETVLSVPALAEHEFTRTEPAARGVVGKRPVSPSLLGKAALRIGSREADSDLGLALAALGLIVAGMRRAPHPVGLPDLAAVAGCAEREDATLAAAPVAGNV